MRNSRVVMALAVAAAALVQLPVRGDEEGDRAERGRELVCLEACRDAEEDCYESCGQGSDDPSDCYEECLEAADACIDECD